MIERDYYPLSDLADRWACKVADILHLGAQDRAQVCVNVYGMSRGFEQRPLGSDVAEGLCDNERLSDKELSEWREAVRLRGAAPPTGEPQTDEERREAEQHDAALERWKARTTEDMPAGIFELTQETLRFLEMPDAFPHELHEGLKFDGRWWACQFDPPPLIGPAHLCMRREEVVRVEREVLGRGKLAPDQLTTRERDTLLRILYGMACAAPYRYDPFAGRSETSATIASATSAAGCAVDADTVRKYLRQAAERFGTRR